MNAGVALRSSVAVPRRAEFAAVRNIARFAVRSLYAELVLYPKPGLVSRRDNGAHRDMNAASFLRSLFALRHYFADIAAAGTRAARLPEMRRLGMIAEARMLAATGGVNTHRGAIFTLGLLSAAAGFAGAVGRPCTDGNLREIVAGLWRRDLLAVPTAGTRVPSHGQQVAARYGLSGARGEAIRGFPAVFGIALPALRDALATGMDSERAQLHAFFTLLTAVADTNVVYRGGSVALDRLQRGAAEFIAGGSVFAAGWRQRAEALHRRCSRQGISPGGCADLLAAAWFVHQLQTDVR